MEPKTLTFTSTRASARTNHSIMTSFEDSLLFLHCPASCNPSPPQHLLSHWECRRCLLSLVTRPATTIQTSQKRPTVRDTTVRISSTPAPRHFEQTTSGCGLLRRSSTIPPKRRQTRASLTSFYCCTPKQVRSCMRYYCTPLSFQSQRGQQPGIDWYSG